MESWPETVRYEPLAGSIQISAPFRAPLKTDMESGRPRKRRSTTKNIATMALSIPMDAAAFATWSSWVRDDVVDGTLSFTAPVWTPTGYVTRTCSLSDGLYQAAPRGNADVLVSLTLEIEDY